MFSYATILPLMAYGLVSVAAQSPVSQQTFDSLVRYVAFASASYANVCETPPSGSSVVRYFSDAESDTQATIFRDDASKEIIVSIRGTSTPADLNADFDFSLQPLEGGQCDRCKVHQGFQKAYLAVADDIISSVQSELSSASDYALIVTGHSLGGAVAALAASSFVSADLAVARVYTYGEPRNGNQEWADYITRQIPVDNYFRVTNFNDGVPQIPPSLIGFAHHHSEYFFSKESSNTPRTVLNCGSSSTKCNNAQSFGDNPINRAHITYGNTVIGNSLFVTGCGAVFP